MMLQVHGMKIKYLRNALGMSQEECCKKAGISRKTLSRLERDCNARPATVRKLAAALGIDARSLAVPESSILGVRVA